MISKRLFWFFNFRSNSFKKKQKPEQKKRQQVQFHETLASQKNHPCSSSLIYEIRPEGSQLRCEGRELHKAINVRWKKKNIEKNCNYFSPDYWKTKNFLMVDNAVNVFFFFLSREQYKENILVHPRGIKCQFSEVLRTLTTYVPNICLSSLFTTVAEKRTVNSRSELWIFVGFSNILLVLRGRQNEYLVSVFNNRA